MSGNPYVPADPPRASASRFWRTRSFWVVGTFLASVVMVATAWFLWPTADVDLKSLLARQLGVEHDSLLFVNLPPAGYRMPGAILLRAGNIPWGKLKVADTDFSRGQRTTQSAHVESVSIASGSLGGSAGQEAFVRDALALLGERSDKVVVDLSFDGSSVELPDLGDRVAQSDAIRAVSESGEDAFVIYRAWQGTLKLGIHTEHGVSARFLDSLADSLSVLAARADANVRFQGDKHTDTQRDLVLAEADVFAYEAYDAASLYHSAALRPVTARTQEVDPDSAVATIIRLDPASIEPGELTETLRYIGPEASKATVRIMQRGTMEDMERGATVLEHVPEEYRPILPADVSSALTSPDPTVRAYAVLAVPTTAATRQVRQLSAALNGDDPVVRFLASEKLGTLESPAATTALRQAVRDPDPAVALSANTALFAATAPVGHELSSASTTLRTGTTQAQTGALRWIRRQRVAADSALPLLVRALSSSDATIRNESLRGLAALGPAASSSAPAVRPLLQDPDPETRKLAQEALQKITGQGGG